MEQLGPCPTTCDDDCESTCHEEHAIPRKRDHEPADCPANQQMLET